MQRQAALTEKEITYQIRSVLKAFGIFHWKVMQGLGCVPGIPDILGIQKGTGKLIAIEVKTAKGKTTRFQDNFINWINEAGGIAFVARSADDVIEKLNLNKRTLIND